MSRTDTSGFLTLVSFVVTLSAGVAAFTSIDDEVQITGVVTVGENSEPHRGARVDALEEGVFLRGSTFTDELGRYELVVPTGFYDLRVLPGESRYIASFARELDLNTRAPHHEDFRLAELELALRESGIELEELPDRDYDAVPDELEEPARLDWEKSDTSEDGVYDGLAGWVGADPLLGPPRTEATPLMIWPPSDEKLAFPVVVKGATPPLELCFQAVPGATGYRVRVHSASGRTERTWDLDFADGELLIGEAVAVRWVPPGGWGPGEYVVETQGWYEAPDRLVGGVARATLRLFEEKEPTPIEIREEVTLSGVHLGSTIELCEGARVIVPAGETLYLVATENVTIDRLASIVGESGEPDEPGEKKTPGASVVILTAGDLLAMGPITAGAGAKGEDVGVEGAKPQVAKATSGLAGGDVVIAALGTVAIGREAQISSGAGGDGGEARAQAPEGKDALAEGGHGGRGGRLLVHASILQVADRPGIVHCGAGGNGGDAHARGGDGALDLQAGLSTVLPGVGGDSGDIWISNWNLRRDGYVALGDESFPVRGGEAGAAGEARPTYGSAGQADGGRSREGRNHEIECTLAGGRGWFRGGDGQSTITRGGEGLGTGDGGKATARAAPGGDVSRLGISAGAFQLIFGCLPVGGKGGSAEATGGSGGPGGTMGPGDGGAATARAGAGGFGLSMPISIFSTGGAGGDATAIAMTGRSGASRCPGRGQDGSDGGEAEATGGAGGFANYRGGAGGAARAEGGDGGSGGMGHGGGRGGAGGHFTARGGEQGGSYLHLGLKGSGTGGPGERGERGPLCPN